MTKSSMRWGYHIVAKLRNSLMEQSENTSKINIKQENIQQQSEGKT